MGISYDGGEAILEALRALGIDHIISSPGSEWAPVWEALARQASGKTPGPDYVDCWHESLAVNVAMGYTRMTGRMQAVMLHAGVGPLQAAMPIHAALLSETPMIVMSGESISCGADPEYDIEPQWYNGLNVAGGAQRLIEPLVKRGSQVTSSYTLYESVINAGELAQRTPMGPVYLDVPIEVMLRPWTPPAVARKVARSSRSVAPPGELETLAALLCTAKNPMIVTEAAGRDPLAFAALIELAETLAIPVIGGRGSCYANFPKNHPLNLGIGNYKPLERADLVLLVACRAPWNPPTENATRGKIVVVDECAIKRDMSYQVLAADSYVEGDIATSLRSLTQAARSAALDPAVIAERKTRWITEHQRFVSALHAKEEASRALVGIDMRSLSAALNMVMPDDVIYVDEAVTNTVIAIQHLNLTQPQSYFKAVYGLGQGVGIALGLKLAAPTRPVVLLCGDGSFLYNPVLAGFGASRGKSLPLLMIVLNNGQYAAMKQGHVHHYPNGEATRSNHFYGVAIDGPAYEALGREFGFHGRRVERVEDLVTALGEALAAVQQGRSAILNVILHPSL